MSITDPAYRYAVYVAHRRNDTKSAEELARELDFGSPEALYRRLRSDRFPVCERCGDPYAPAPDHCPDPDASSGRRARNTGEATELPPPALASDLLRPVLHRLAATVDELDHRREQYRARRFERADPLDDPVALSRQQFSQDEWLAICEEIGEDPQQHMILLHYQTTLFARGASYAPRDTALIAAYILCGGDPEPLLEALHPDPDNADREKLLYSGTERYGAKVEELHTVAAQVARLVRGGHVGPGRVAEELSRSEQATASEITRRLSNGEPSEQVKEDLRERGFSSDDYERLRR